MGWNIISTLAVASLWGYAHYDKQYSFRCLQKKEKFYVDFSLHPFLHGHV